MPSESTTYRHGPEDSDQDDGADERDGDAPEQPHGRAWHQEPEHDAADEGPDDPEDDVADQP